MKLRGGYNLFLAGRPSKEIRGLAPPEKLYLPLKSRRFRFSELCVSDGQKVGQGEVLAKDPANFSIPLLSPYKGVVSLNEVEGHIILANVELEKEEPSRHDKKIEHIRKDVKALAHKREKLLELGAWQFFTNAHTGAPADPSSSPQAVIVSTINLEPFIVRGDVKLTEHLPAFAQGLEHLQSLLDYQPIYLVIPDIDSPFAREVRDVLQGYAWIKLVQVPLRYPFDNFAILARHLGLARDAEKPVWGLPAVAVIAVDHALSLSQPFRRRIISLGGPAIGEPVHLKVVAGYPIKDILEGHIGESSVRVINGGILTGQILGREQMGLDVECQGLTVLEEQAEREMLGFMRPGLTRRSYSRCFLSSLRGGFGERLNTALRGERRPCVACGQCVKVCPAGIMPNVIHKLLYHEAWEQANQAGLELCVECGLCSYVCPSKIELLQEFLDAKESILKEVEAAEVAE